MNNFDPEAQEFLNQMFELYHPEPSMESIVEKLREGADTFNAQIAYNLNVDFDGREPVQRPAAEPRSRTGSSDHR